MIGIYKITSPLNKIYIGSSINIEKRKKHYKNLDCKAQRKLYNSFKKYGFENHSFEVIEECEIEHLYLLENKYGLLFNVLDKKLGLNLSLPNIGDKKAIISQETKDKMSISQRGVKNNFFGKKHSIESIEKQRIAQSNRSIETLKKMRNAQIGKKATHESKLKMSLAQKGRKHTEETLLKMRLNNRNMKIVLNIRTGIFYYGTADAANSENLNRNTLKNMLNGSKPNKSNFIYV